MLYFEDIEIGQQKEVGRHTPSREEIISFASQWDPQPFHIDEEAARASVFGGLSASSCHTYAICSLIFSRSAPKLKTAAMLGLEVNFPMPVRPDEELTMSETFLEKRPSGSRPTLGVVKSRTSLRNPRGEEVMRMESNYLVERRADEA
jgi:acyl dehydratase